MGRGKSNKVNSGSLTGNAGLNTIRNSQLRDRTNSVDAYEVMRDAYFSSAGELLRTVRKAEGGRYDVLDNTNNGDYGTIMYTDSYSSDGLAYEAYWERDYEDPERKRIRIRRFRTLEEGEW